VGRPPPATGIAFPSLATLVLIEQSIEGVPQGKVPRLLEVHAHRKANLLRQAAPTTNKDTANYPTSRGNHRRSPRSPALSRDDFTQPKFNGSGKAVVGRSRKNSPPAILIIVPRIPLRRPWRKPCLTSLSGCPPRSRLNRHCPELLELSARPFSAPFSSPTNLKVRGEKRDGFRSRRPTRFFDPWSRCPPALTQLSRASPITELDSKRQTRKPLGNAPATCGGRNREVLKTWLSAYYSPLRPQRRKGSMQFSKTK